MPYAAANFVRFINDNLTHCVDERYIQNDLAALLAQLNTQH
jgi:LysR family transcriptional regulator, low CO2-responsive transcriptional regulator